MKIEKNRHLVILYMLMNSSDPLTSEQLAAASHASSRTIKTDINDLNAMLRKEGIAEIVSLKSKGYSLSAMDPAKYIHFQRMLINLHSFYGTRPVEATNRRLYIIQKLLSSSYVKIEDLSERMYVSRSVISNDLTSVENFFSSYNLKTISVPGHGLTLKGSESDIRSCMVEANSTQYRDFSLGYPVPEFSSQFYLDRQDYEDIRHAMLKAIRESEITLTDIATKRCATYLVLIAGRRKLNKFVQMDLGLVNELRVTYEFNLAKSIFSIPLIRDYTHADEADILDFTRQLIVGRDFDLRSLQELRTIQPVYLATSSKLFSEALDMVKNGIGRSFYEMPLFNVYRNDFESLVLHIYMENYFSRADHEHIVTYTEDTHYRISPVCMQLARELVAALEKKLGQAITGSVITSFGELYNFIMKKVDYSYRKRRIAVVSTDGKAVGEQLRESLLDHFGRYIETSDVYAQYELRRVKFSDYDALVTENKAIDNRYPLPAVQYDALEPFGSSTAFFKSLFLPGFSISFLNHMKEITHCYSDIVANDLDALKQFVSFHYATENNESAITDRFDQYESIYTYFSDRSSTALVYLDYGDTKKSILDVYALKNGITMDNDTVLKYMVVWCEDPSSISIGDLKLYDRMLEMLAWSEGWVESLLKDGEDTWDNAFVMIMENRFNAVR